MIWKDGGGFTIPPPGINTCDFAAPGALVLSIELNEQANNGCHKYGYSHNTEQYLGHENYHFPNGSSVPLTKEHKELVLGPAFPLYVLNGSNK